MHHRLLQHKLPESLRGSLAIATPVVTTAAFTLNAATTTRTAPITAACTTSTAVATANFDERH